MHLIQHVQGHAHYSPSLFLSSRVGLGLVTRPTVNIECRFDTKYSGFITVFLVCDQDHVTSRAPTGLFAAPGAAALSIGHTSEPAEWTHVYL